MARFNLSVYLPSLTLRGLIKGIVYALLLGGVYYGMLVYLLHLWENEDFSHCYLIPVVTLYLIWEKRAELARLPSVPSWTGLIPIGIGIVFFWLGELGGEYFTLNMSFWLVIVGLLWLHLGWLKIKTIWFALIMMLAMFPFPNFITTRITLQLRLISSKLGVWMLHLYGMSAYREGNVIDLGFTQLQVVDACSGLRYVMPLMVLSLLLAYWFSAHWWKKTVLFLSAIPLAIVVNSFRIAATGVLYSMFGAEVAEGFFHGFSGWLIFMFAIPFLLFEMWALRRIPPRGPRDEGSAKGVEGRGKREAQNLREALLRPKFIVAVAILLLTFGLSQGIEFRQKIPINKSFGQFPMQIGEWQGAREDMEQQFLDVLKFSDYIMVNYKNSQGKAINFYVAYYQDQRKGEAIHSPETCLPSSGWEFKEAGNATIPAAGGKPSMRVNRSFMEKGNVRELVYYWFPQRGRILTNLYQLKVYAFWDSLTRQRTDGAMVRVITDVDKEEKLSDAEARLQEFIGKVTPVLDEYIPK
ncbi:MAG: VPLPA-CTERM-specific exosortase XrtD [Syntrophus sp. (in: bacteria)]|nr:VPLPA-CTERM-specific exosortase XrtD [Syntrophus sp. (in: bacteria)]